MQPDEAYFWRTHIGAELDLLLLKDGRRLGVKRSYALAERVTAAPLTIIARGDAGALFLAKRRRKT